ncbi:MAG: hypothetical protein MHPSP_000629, partial [Paramarteilia canceri]
MHRKLFPNSLKNLARSTAFYHKQKKFNRIISKNKKEDNGYNPIKNTFKIDDSALMKEVISHNEETVPRDLFYFGPEMVANMACMNWREMQAVRFGEKKPDKNKEIELKQYNEELTRKDLDYISSYLDISINSLHGGFYKKALDSFIKYFNKDITKLHPSDYCLENISNNAFKIMAQLRTLKEYELMHCHWMTTSSFSIPKNEHLYHYLSGILESQNYLLIEETKKYLKALSEKKDMNSFYDYISDLFIVNEPMKDFLSEIFSDIGSRSKISKLSNSIKEASEAKFSPEYIQKRKKNLSNLEMQLNNEINTHLQLETSSVHKKSCQSINTIYEDWISQITDELQQKIVELMHGSDHSLYEKIESSSPRSLLPYLTLFNPEYYARLVARETISLFTEWNTDSQSLEKKLANKFTDSIFSYYTSKKIRYNIDYEKFKEAYSLYLDWFHLQKQATEKQSTTFATRNILSSYGLLCPLMLEHKWPNYIQIQIGNFFKSIIVEKLTFKINNKHYEPVCSKIELQEGKPSILVNKTLSSILVNANKKVVNSSAYPMLIPPMPWLDKYSGSFLIRREPFIRQNLPKTCFLRHENSIERISSLIEGCNSLASVPWEINKDILNVISTIYDQGGSTKLEIPSKIIRKISKPSPLFNSFASKESYEQYYWRQRKNDQEFSLRCDFMIKYMIAGSLKDMTFWQPHNIDFRSRVYTLSPYLTHYSNDIGRSLLNFSNKKPLQPHGLSWLKIDCLNKMELMKFDSSIEKLRYFDTVMKEKIFEVAENPYLNNWWMDSEKPWQVLASILELSKALKSDVPESFESCIPVHQDGSCNGLQHYAAIMRDKSGGESVNLYPSSQKCDVYSDVKDIVIKKNNEMILEGSEIAKKVSDFIDRKTIKQAIMTTVYGVTLIGAKEMIKKQLEERNFDQKYLIGASIHLASLTLKSLEELFPAGEKLR